MLSGGGNYTITNGGTITLTKNSTNAYGIQVAEGKNQGTNLTVGGKLTVKIDNRAYANNGDKVMGVWKLGGYNLIPGGEQPEDQGGKITLNEAEIDVTGKGTAYGLAAGNDFGNNSAGGGTIVVNGNLNVTAHTLSEYGDNSTDQSKTFGAVATDGFVVLNGRQSEINVIADQSNGGINHEIAGLYTSDGGKICSSADSRVDVTVTSKNGGKIYGASSGFYDMVYTSSQGQSGIDLEGTTRFQLDTKGKAAGIHSAYKAYSKADTVYIDFLNDESTNAFGRVGRSILSMWACRRMTASRRCRTPQRLGHWPRRMRSIDTTSAVMQEQSRSMKTAMARCSSAGRSTPIIKEISISH